MMATIFQRGREQARKQLQLQSKGGKGAPCTVVQFGPQQYVNGANTRTEVSHAGSGIRTRYALKDIDGVRVQSGDFKLLLCPVKIDGQDMPEPQVAWEVLFAAERYKVVSVAPWNYDGVPCGFAVQVRK